VRVKTVDAASTPAAAAAAAAAARAQALVRLPHGAAVGLGAPGVAVPAEAASGAPVKEEDGAACCVAGRGWGGFFFCEKGEVAGERGASFLFKRAPTLLPAHKTHHTQHQHTGRPVGRVLGHGEAVCSMEVEGTEEKKA